MGRAVAFSRFHPRRAPRFDTAFFAADSLRIENTAVHPTRYFVLLLLFFYAVRGILHRNRLRRKGDADRRRVLYLTIKFKINNLPEGNTAVAVCAYAASYGHRGSAGG